MTHLTTNTPLTNDTSPGTKRVPENPAMVRITLDLDQDWKAEAAEALRQLADAIEGGSKPVAYYSDDRDEPTAYVYYA